MSAPERTSRDLLDTGRLTEMLAALVSVPSENPPGNESAVAPVVASLCEGLGLEVSQHEAKPGRPNVVARWKQGEWDSGVTVTFCSHIDVVPAGDPRLWAADPYAAIVRDGAMHGRGTADAKGPCAAALGAVGLMQEMAVTFDGTLELVFVSDEESGGFDGAEPLVASGEVGGSVVVVGEPTSLRVVRAQRGIAWTRITTRGKAAHGSAPERGINAIRHMAEVIAHLDDSLPDVDHPLLGRPTINVGTIGGGTKLNVTPAECTMEVDRRIVPGEDEASAIETFRQAIAKAKERFPDIDAEIEVVGSGPPFEIDEDAPLVQAAVEAVAHTGRSPEIVGFRGASDARFFAETGADVIVFGPGDIAVAHTAHESIEIDELADGALAYAWLFAKMLG